MISHPPLLGAGAALIAANELYERQRKALARVRATYPDLDAGYITGVVDVYLRTMNEPLPTDNLSAETGAGSEELRA